MTASEKAYAKVNLSLSVLRKRADGYHDLQMVAQTMSLCDDITISLIDNAPVSVKCNMAHVPSDGRNLAAAAAKLFFSRTGLWNGGAVITIEKRIPVGAGLGGGSADAAAVLRALNNLLAAGLNDNELSELALRLGSDVPFCLRGGTQLMEGRGEILTRLPPLPECVIIVCKPSDPLSTERVFSCAGADAVKYRPDNAGMIAALERGDINDFSRRMFNSLESTAVKMVKEISGIQKSLIENGALGACMTGTGSAVTGLFTDPNAAQNAAAKLSKTYAETFIMRPVPRCQ